MADNFWYQTPPAYEAPPTYEQLVGPSEAAAQVFLDRIQDAVDAEYSSTTQDSTETKRLRNFLLYCLAVDYRYPCSLSIQAPDREHFLELSGVLQSMRTRHAFVQHMSQDDRIGLAPYLWKYLHEPCNDLAIPVESAVGIITRYAKYLNFYGRHKGCIHGVLHGCGIGMLAQKMSIDRSVLIPRLATSEETRRELTEKVVEIARPYFTSIGGMTSETTISEDPGRFTEQVRYHYTLTPRGKLYDENQKFTLDTVKESVSHIFDGVITRILGMKRKNGEVFAKSSFEEFREFKRIRPSSVPAVAPRDSANWSSPPQWRDHESVFLPDLFEHRTGRGFCDM